MFVFYLEILLFIIIFIHKHYCHFTIISVITVIIIIKYIVIAFQFLP